MKEIVAAQDLRVGMFVSELDRPWLGSPFLLQGFLIEDPATLKQLCEVCRFVYVDRTRSTGDAWRSEPEPAVEQKERTAGLGRFQAPPEARRRPVDFFALLRSLRSAAGSEAVAGQASASAAMAPWLHVYPDSIGMRSHVAGEAGPDVYVPGAPSRPLVTSVVQPRRAGAGVGRDESRSAVGGPAGMVYVEPSTLLEEEILAAFPLVAPL